MKKENTKIKQGVLRILHVMDTSVYEEGTNPNYTRMFMEALAEQTNADLEHPTQKELDAKREKEKKEKTA